ncbi:adenine phosphoribosyltransferase [candidate division KSB1 bacterium]
MAPDLKTLIRSIPDFPKAGIMFRDISTLLKDPAGLSAAVDWIVDQYKAEEVDAVAGIESRGFILGGVVAHELGTGFIPMRKPGKLPAETVKAAYELEYGTDSLEMHIDAISTGQRVLVVDDLLATGGTARAAVELVEKLGGTVLGPVFLIELTFLDGRSRLKGRDIRSLIQYDSE